METYSARISPDGRFVATSGFTPDVRVWEVVCSKSGEFERVARAFELTGHTSGIYSFDFSPDSGRMVSVSKDGTWRLYNTASKCILIPVLNGPCSFCFYFTVDYKQGQLATLVVSGKYKGAGLGPARVALSPDGRVVAVGSGTSIYCYSTLNGELSAHIPDVHSGKRTMRQMEQADGVTYRLHVSTCITQIVDSRVRAGDTKTKTKH